MLTLKYYLHLNFIKRCSDRECALDTLRWPLPSHSDHSSITADITTQSIMQYITTEWTAKAGGFRQGHIKCDGY